MKTLIVTLLAATALSAIPGGAMAADLAMPAAAPMMAAPAPGNWDGPYIGASVGYGWGAADNSYTGNTTGTSSTSVRGWLVGAQAGYNFHLADNIVAGIEGNIDWVNETSDGDFFKVDWEGSVRARLGYDAGQFLPYVEAGVAFANGTYTDNSSATSVQTGWTVGAGIEFMLANNLSANLEYRYADYGTHTYNTTSYANSVHLTDSTVRVGLNYHF